MSTNIITAYAKRHSRHAIIITKISKAYWKAIETGKHPNVKWNIEKQAQPYQNGKTDVTFV